MVKQLCFNICKLEDSRLANTDIKDILLRIEQIISESLQYGSLYWSTHLLSTPDEIQRGVILGRLKEFLEGPYPLYWIEVLSVMGMVLVGAPSLRGMKSLVKVSPWEGNLGPTSYNHHHGLAAPGCCYPTPSGAMVPCQCSDG